MHVIGIVIILIYFNKILNLPIVHRALFMGTTGTFARSSQFLIAKGGPDTCVYYIINIYFFCKNLFEYLLGFLTLHDYDATIWHLPILLNNDNYSYL